MLSKRIGTGWLTPQGFHHVEPVDYKNPGEVIKVDVICSDSLGPATYTASINLFYTVRDLEIAHMYALPDVRLTGNTLSFPRCVFDVYWGCEHE